MNQDNPRGLIIENNHDFPMANIIKAHHIGDPGDYLQICSN